MFVYIYINIDNLLCFFFVFSKNQNETITELRDLTVRINQQKNNIEEERDKLKQNEGRWCW